MIVAVWRRFERWSPFVRWRFFVGMGGGASGTTNWEELVEEIVE
jgi:hypothetical protein